MFADFKSITEIIKKFKSLYAFGGRSLNIRDVCMDFEPCFKVHHLVSVHPKSIKLGQMTYLNVIFQKPPFWFCAEHALCNWHTQISATLAQCTVKKVKGLRSRMVYNCNDQS